MVPEIYDPKGLIKDSYLIDGISAPECRTIFLDWAIGVPQDRDMAELLQQLLAEYSQSAPEHPMTTVLRNGLGTPLKARRKGGRKGRLNG